MTQDEFEDLLLDETKTIEGDIDWSDDEDHSPAVEFQAAISNAQNMPVELRGSYNQILEKLTFAVIHRGLGRIYSLDLGHDHRNPDTGDKVGDKHKHRWSEIYKAKVAYVPDDITEPANFPLLVWEQFCAEFRLTHNGQMRSLPPIQGIIGL
ncbi:MAG: hypothetical protein C0473_04470 [Cyanobacteria bacterium DS3.002]|nr:hypothetical protein [Cyanobacteria bacterium DS3.002]